MRLSTFFCVMAVSATSFAQKGVEDGSRFGHGQDSIECLNNISIYSEYVKTNNFNEAYEPWKKVFNNAPLAQVATYTNGFKILKNLIAKSKDLPQRKAYADELMAVYDQELKYLDQLDLLVKASLKDYKVKGQKAHDYITYYPQMSVDTAYVLLTDALDLGKGNSEYYIVGDFMKISSMKFKENEAHREQFIQDYLTASEYIGLIAEATEKANFKDESLKTKLKEAVATTKENVDAYFINSGAADCDHLQTIYAPKVEENKADLEYLKKVVAVMAMLKCTESDVYFVASEYAHAISPTSQTAAGCGYRYFKRGDLAKAFEFFNEAIELENDSKEKASLNYKTAVILNSDKQYQKAKTYCQRAIALNPDNGAPYVLLAKLYAASPNWNSEPVLNRCTYYVVLDKLMQAKRVDASVADEANELIATYREHTPSLEDLFFLGLKKGDVVKVEGWINESTTIR